MKNRPNTSSRVESITLNLPLFAVVIGVMIILVTAHMAAWFFPTNTILGFILPFFLLATFLLLLLSALYEIVRQFIHFKHEYQAFYNLCASAFLCSFLLYILIIPLILINFPASESMPLVGLSMFFSLLSLGGLHFIATQQHHRQQDQKQLLRDLEGPGLQIQQLTQRSDMIPFPAPNLKTGLHSIKPSPPQQLPPLFLDDPLYVTPHITPRPHQVRFFSLAKAHEHPVFNDDACVISRDETRFALCDGASGSGLPRPWGTLLGQQWLKAPLLQPGVSSQQLLHWLEEPRKRWASWVKQTWQPTVNARNRLTGDPQVFPEEIQRILLTGASATFLGLEIDYQQRHYHVLAIGDTCLLLARRNQTRNVPIYQIAMSLPLDTSTSFTQRPPLLSSRLGEGVDHLLPSMYIYDGTFSQGDFLLLATDALAQWLLLQTERRQSEWIELLMMKEDDGSSFAKLIEKQREIDMDDDDTTLVIIPL